MTLALAGARRDAGVTIAQVNLKFINDALSRIKVGGHARAYVVDAAGRLIAHPDINLVLRKTDMSALAQVRSARQAGDASAEQVQEADDAGAIYVFDERQREFYLRSTYGMNQELIAALRKGSVGLDDPNLARAIAQGDPIQVADLQDDAQSPLNEIILRAGFRARLVAPLIHGGEVVGMLVVRRRTPGAFPANTVDLMRTFAAQSVLAIQNARLFHEIEDKGHQIEAASKHKSQFLANMSHELRTPLNAIIGYTELILDSIYGEAPEKMRSVLERVQANGKHLLGLINDVLDLSKIEAGQLTLSLSQYSLAELVQSVYVAVEPLAAQKNLTLTTDVANGLPTGYGDERRLAQVLLNLVGNAIRQRSADAL